MHTCSQGISFSHAHMHICTSVWPRGGGELGDNSVCEGMSSSSDESDVEWEDVEPGDQSEEFLHEHGFASRGITIPIEISSSSHVDITETEDNSSIIATLRESHHLLTEKYLPAITRWMEVGRQLTSFQGQFKKSGLGTRLGDS